MSKKPVSYIKPKDPSFLVKLKKEAGYVEGPTVETKKQVQNFDSGSEDETNDDKPVVVVLKDGDLTAEEAENLQNKLDIEKITAKADLTQRVVFQKPTNSKRSSEAGEEEKDKKKAKKEKKNVKKQLLSFGEDDEEN